MPNIVYVFTATNWQAINLAPLLQIDNVSQLLALVCRRGGTFAPDDRRHAEDSIGRFVQAYKLEKERFQKMPQPRVSLSVGPLEGVAYWRRQVVQDLADSIEGAPEGATVVFNYLAGPSDAKIGVWLGLEDLKFQRPDLTIRRVSFGTESRLLWREEDGTETDQPLTRTLGIDGWFSLRGLVEPAAWRQERMEREARARRLEHVTKQLGELCFEHPTLPSGWLVDLLCKIPRIGGTCNIVHLARKQAHLAALPNDQFFSTIEAIVATIAELGNATGEVDTRGVSIRIQERSWISRWLISDWFEDFVYLRLLERLPRECLALGLRLERETLPEHEKVQVRGHAAYELDVVALGSNQIHLVECKAFSRGADSKARKAWIFQCSDHRAELVGPGGLAYGFSTAPLPEVSVTRIAAREHGVLLATNAPEIREAIDSVVQACQR